MSPTSIRPCGPEHALRANAKANKGGQKQPHPLTMKDGVTFPCDLRAHRIVIPLVEEPLLEGGVRFYALRGLGSIKRPFPISRVNVFFFPQFSVDVQVEKDWLGRPVSRWDWDKLPMHWQEAMLDKAAERYHYFNTETIDLTH